MITKTMTDRNSQQGFSIIELMIAVTLGMVLMGAALQFIISTKQTYELNDDISRIQENGRMALDIIVKDLQMAGYRQPLNGDGKIPDFFLKECAAAAPCVAEGAGILSDTLSIQYDPPPDDGVTPDTDCLGVAIPAPATDIIVNVYTVQDPENDGISSLFCRGYNATTGAWISPNQQPLVDGIDNMQVLYRVSNAAGTSFRYVSRDQLVDDDFPYISAARVALLVSNGQAQGSADSKTRQYQVLDSPTITFNNDRQPRRIYSTTVQFNNQSI
jgi:type IV pilus assembly protein PilW